MLLVCDIKVKSHNLNTEKYGKLKRQFSVYMYFIQVITILGEG